MEKRKEERIEVTEENFGDLLIQGLEEARAVARGELEPTRRVRRTVRETLVEPPRCYGADEIRRIRSRFGSQQVFARLLNASPDTVRAWEQGKREPDGMALALLQVAENHPEVLMERVRERPARKYAPEARDG